MTDNLNELARWLRVLGHGALYVEHSTVQVAPADVHVDEAGQARVSRCAASMGRR